MMPVDQKPLDPKELLGRKSVSEPYRDKVEEARKVEENRVRKSETKETVYFCSKRVGFKTRIDSATHVAFTDRFYNTSNPKIIKALRTMPEHVEEISKDTYDKELSILAEDPATKETDRLVQETKRLEELRVKAEAARARLRAAEAAIMTEAVARLEAQDAEEARRSGRDPDALRTGALRTDASMTDARARAKADAEAEARVKAEAATRTQAETKAQADERARQEEARRISENPNIP